MIEGTLVFCKDGILRIQSNLDGKTSLPALAVQAAYNDDPSIFFLRLLEFPAILEQGVTLGGFLLNLEPWKLQASALTDRNVDQYITELRKPSSEENAFDEIIIRKTGHISRQFIHSEIPEDVDFIEWFNRSDKEPPKWSDDVFSFSYDFTINGYIDGDISNYSVSTSIHSIKNVPLSFDETEIFAEFHPKRAEQQAMFDNNSVGVIAVPDTNMVYVKTHNEASTTFQDLIKSVVMDGLWFSTPRGAIAQREMLEDRMDELGLTDLGDDEVTEDASSDDDQPTKKIVIAEGAFDSITEHFESAREEWDNLTKAVAKAGESSVSPTRIGQVQRAKPRSNRAFGLILD